MNLRRLPVLSAFLGVATMLGVLVAPAASAASTGNTVRIGLEAPLTGDQRATGEEMLRGAELAADELNAKGGIAGKQVEIVPIDDAADPDTGVKAANAAIASGLDGIVGPYNSGVGAKTLPLYLAAGLVPIRLTSADGTNGMGLTLQPMTYQIAPVAADALTQWLKAKSVAIVFDDSTLYTQTVSTALKQELDAAAVTITAFEPIQPGAKSYASTIEKVAATDPDVVYLAAYYPEAGLMAKAMVRGKVAAKCLADYGAYSNGFAEAAGKRVARTCPVVGVPAAHEFSGAKPYMAAYRKEFKEAPGVWTPYTYDSLNFLASGVARAGGFDATALTTALEAEKDFVGWTGSVAIDPATGNREPATVVVLSTDRGGNFHLNTAWAKAVGARV